MTKVHAHPPLWVAHLLLKNGEMLLWRTHMLTWKQIFLHRHVLQCKLLCCWLSHAKRINVNEPVGSETPIQGSLPVFEWSAWHPEGYVIGDRNETKVFHKCSGLSRGLLHPQSMGSFSPPWWKSSPSINHVIHSHVSARFHRACLPAVSALTAPLQAILLLKWVILFWQ